MKNIFKRLNNDQRGVTLIEILIVMGLLSTLLIVIATIFTSAVDVQQQSNSYSATNSSGRFIMQRLDWDISHASIVNTPSVLGTSSSNLNLTISGNSYNYVLNGNDLQLTDNIGTDNLNSNDVTVSGLNFQILGNSGGKPTIQYSFTLTSIVKNHGNSSVQSFTGTEGLR